MSLCQQWKDEDVNSSVVWAVICLVSSLFRCQRDTTFPISMPSQSALHGICSIQRLVICNLQISCHKILSLQPVPKRSTVIVSYFKEEAIGLKFLDFISKWKGKWGYTRSYWKSPFCFLFFFICTTRVQTAFMWWSREDLAQSFVMAPTQFCSIITYITQQF